jgi:hypothetical protein
MRPLAECGLGSDLDEVVAVGVDWPERPCGSAPATLK